MQPSYYILYLYKSINKIFDRKSSLSQLRKRRGSIWGNPVCTVIRWLKFFCGERKGLGRACASEQVCICVCTSACNRVLRGTNSELFYPTPLEKWRETPKTP